MISRQLKAWAREALRGHWGTAIAVCLVASLLGGGAAPVPDTSGAQSAGSDMIDIAGAWPMAVTIMIVAILLAVVIGGALSLGMSHYFINLTAHRPSKFSDLFARFRIWYKGIGMSLAVTLFVFLWTLPGVIIACIASVWLLMGAEITHGSMSIVMILSVLGSIPGIIASYRYAMMPYLLAEFPDLTVMDAMRESKRLMHGNKFRFFSLSFSFIGWILLSTFTLFIGLLWIVPYMNAACAAFYLDVTGRSDLRHMQPEN